MGQKILGLDLGTYAIKATLIERNWQDFTVLHYMERVNDVDPALSPFQQLSYNVQKFFEAYPLPADTFVVTAMPGHLVQYRFLNLPFGSMKKIEQAMEFELENYIPLDLDKVWFDYHVFSLGKTRSEVMVAYTQRDDFETLYQTLDQYKLNVRKLSGDAADLSHLSRVAMLPAAGQYALLDYGHRKTSIAVFEGQTLQFIRTIAIGSDALSQKIAQGLSVEWAEAERLKKEELELQPYLEGETPLEQVAYAELRDWLVLVRQSIAAYGHSDEGRHVEAMYTLGGGSRLKGLQKVLSSYLKMNVTSLDSLAFTPHRLREPAKIMPSFSPSFAIALNSLHGPKQVDINFLKGEFAYRGDIEGLAQGARRAAIWIGLVLAAGVLHYAVSYHSLSSKVEQVRQETKAILGKDLGAALAKNKTMSLTTALSIINGKTEELRTQLGALAGSSATPQPVVVLREISTQMPKNDESFTLDVDSLNITETLVRLEGKTASFEAVDRIKQALSESSQFFDVKVDNVGKGLKDDVKFSVSLSLEKKETP